MNWANYIVADKNILLGKPVIKGTRISVELISELFMAGWSDDIILESYPSLTLAHLESVRAFLLNNGS